MEKELIIPEWFFKEPIENKIKNINNPEPLKQIAPETNLNSDKQVNEAVAKTMINPYVFC